MNSRSRVSLAVGVQARILTASRQAFLRVFCFFSVMNREHASPPFSPVGALSRLLVIRPRVPEASAGQLGGFSGGLLPFVS